ncbi:hypothetical protein D3C84_930660 [compost metagenome]
MKMIEHYLDEYEKIRPVGKIKNATLDAIKDTWLGELDDSALNSQKLVEFAQWQMSEKGCGVQSQTVGNDLSHLVAVLSVARPGAMRSIRWPCRTRAGCCVNSAW